MRAPRAQDSAKRNVDYLKCSWRHIRVSQVAKGKGLYSGPAGPASVRGFVRLDYAGSDPATAGYLIPLLMRPCSDGVQVEVRR